MDKKVEQELKTPLTAEEKAAAYDKMIQEGKAKPKVSNEDTVVFRTLPKGDKNKIELRRSVYKEREILGLQQFYKEDIADSDWKYGKAITFSFEDIDDIIKGLEDMKDWCEEHA